MHESELYFHSKSALARLPGSARSEILSAPVWRACIVVLGRSRLLIRSWLVAAGIQGSRGPNCSMFLGQAEGSEGF